jgi:hypothetical protein
MRLGRVSVPTALLVAAVAASGVLLIAWQSHLTFFFDDWDPLLQRRGFDAGGLLRPHVGHILLGTTLVYKAIQATFGMESLAPYAAASTSLFLVSVILLFIYLRRRVGEWWALAGVLPILFLGSASGDLLLPFQVFFFGAMAAGLGALLVFERRDRRGDVMTCLLLSVSITFSELALSFVLGVAVAIALDRGPLRRAYIVALPLLLYAGWYAGWGHTGPSYLSFNNVAHSVAYVLDGLASGIVSLLGLTGSGAVVSGGLGWGRPLLLALFVVMGLRARSATPIARSFWVTVVIVLSFWFLAAANATIFRAPTSSRYQFIAAVFILLIAADLASGMKLRRSGIVIGMGVAGIAVAANLSLLHQSYLTQAAGAPPIRGQLSALEIGADSIKPGLVVQTTASRGGFPAVPYLSAVDAFGSPAYTQSELVSAPETARVAADRELAAVLGLALHPAAHPPRPGGTGCRRVRTASGVSPVLNLPPAGVILEAPKDATSQVSLRRFATQSFPVSVGSVSGSAILAVPKDRSTRPWQMQIASAAPVTICGRTG